MEGGLVGILRILHGNILRFKKFIAIFWET